MSCSCHLSAYELLAGPAQCAYQIMMLVLAHQCSFDTLCSSCMVRSDGGDVDEQPSIGIDPSCVNHIKLVRRGSVRIPRIDLQQVCSSLSITWQPEMILCHVVVLREEGDRRLRHLHVNVRVPRQYLLVPPPSQ